MSACAAPTPSSAGPGDELVPDRVVFADLDGDDENETVGIEQAGALVIEDTDATYRSRDRWNVAQACLGDTDGNGLLEVIALLDDSKGRHLGLFAWMEGRYRERVVTAVLTPRPLRLRIIPSGTTGPRPDLVVLTEEVLPAEQVPPNPTAGDLVTTETVYRWNGFGFTAIETTDPQSKSSEARSGSV